MEAPSFYKSLSESEQSNIREWGQLYRLCTLPFPEDMEVGSIVIPTGDWLDRVAPAANLFMERFDSQKLNPSLVITGANGSQYRLPDPGANAEMIGEELRKLGNMTEEMKNNIVEEGRASNTKEQAENVYELLSQGSIKDPLVLFVSAWHLPRNYSTFVKTVLNHEHPPKTRIYSVPVYKDWNGMIEKDPVTTPSRRKKIIPEMKRIIDYREKGDVASFREVEEYTSWLDGRYHFF